jgi:hypothetical protein
MRAVIENMRLKSQTNHSLHGNPVVMQRVIGSILKVSALTWSIQFGHVPVWGQLMPRCMLNMLKLWRFTQASILDASL